MTSARGISFEIRPSATLTRLLALMVALAALAPLLTALPAGIRWPLAAGIGVFGITRVRRYRSPSLRRLVWLDDGVWVVTDRRGRVCAAELRAARRVGQCMILSLRWRLGAGHVALLPDNTAPDALRMLRARLAGQSPES